MERVWSVWEPRMGVLGKSLVGAVKPQAPITGCCSASTGRCPMRARPGNADAAPSTALLLRQKVRYNHCRLHSHPCTPCSLPRGYPLQAHGTRIHENSPIANGPISHVCVSPIRAVFCAMACFSVESSPVLQARSTKPNNQGQRERGPPERVHLATIV